MQPLRMMLDEVKLLEPAIIGTDEVGPHFVKPEHMLFSIAVSLKRIADIMEEQHQSVWPATAVGELREEVKAIREHLQS